MSQLCLSAALLVLLVILVDGTPKGINKSHDHGLQISHGRGPEKPSLTGIVSKIFDGVRKGVKTMKEAGKDILKKLQKTIYKNGHKAHGKQLEKRSVKELPEQTLRHATSRPSICLDPAFPGPCHEQKTRYFYNAETGRCEVFIYGGCKGNKNNFRTERGCKKICGEGIVFQWSPSSQ